MADQQPKVGIFEFMEQHLDYRIKLLLPVLLIAGCVVLWNYIRDLQGKVAEQEKVVATLKQDFQQIGASAVTKNDLQTQRQLDAQASQLFGQQVMDFMKQENSRLNSLTTAVGTVQGTVNGLQQQMTSFKPGQQDTTTGALRGVTLEENRVDKPPLASVNLFYDPKQTDPNLAFKGTTWQHYAERFNVATGEWEQDKTHGYKNTVKLTRTVTKPDGTVATEEIPVTEGSTIYTPKGIGTDPFKVPRWTASIGVSKDANGYQPAGFLDYRVTRKVGVFGGVASRGVVGGLSIRFGEPK